MKIKSLLVAACAVFFVACGSVDNTPEAVTTAFVKAMADLDFDEAKGYCVESSAKDLDGLKAAAAFGKAKTVDKEEVKCNINGDEAKCTFCCVEGKQETYDLVKVNGNWKVKYSKNVLNNAKDGLENLDESMDDLKEGLDQLKDTLTEVFDSVSVE